MSILNIYWFHFLKYSNKLQIYLKLLFVQIIICTVWNVWKSFLLLLLLQKCNTKWQTGKRLVNMWTIVQLKSQRFPSWLGEEQKKTLNVIINLSGIQKYTNAVSCPLHARLFDFKFAIHINLKDVYVYVVFVLSGEKRKLEYWGWNKSVFGMWAFIGFKKLWQLKRLMTSAGSLLLFAAQTKYLALKVTLKVSVEWANTACSSSA